MVSWSCEELAGARRVERLGQEGREVVDDDPVARELGANASCSCLARAAHMHVVEEQLVDIGRGEPAQLDARAVHDDLLSVPTSESTWKVMAWCLSGT